MKASELGFRTLTPLWTGDVSGESPVAQATGLIGSIRWWYEGLLRGLAIGKSEKRDACSFDGQRFQCLLEEGFPRTEALARAGLCPACRLFGSTGYRRPFRLVPGGLFPHRLFFVASPEVYVSAGNWLWKVFGGQDKEWNKRGRGKETIFEIKAPALWGEEAFLRLIPSNPADIGVVPRLAFVLDLMSRYGALGAKSQFGFGQFQFSPPLPQSLVEEGRRLTAFDVELGPPTCVSISSQPACQRLSGREFNLATLFSRVYEIGVEDPYRPGRGREIGEPDSRFRGRYIPCSFDIRYKSRQRDPFTKQGRDFGMRPWFRARWGDTATMALFGPSRVKRDADRAASRIKVSHLFREGSNDGWRLKVWGSVPPGIEVRGTRIGVEEVAEEVDRFIRSPEGMFPGSTLIEEFDRAKLDQWRDDHE